jgi:poly-gamma-glutamate capsule biosynthesis protein CapA/YwtB (metallophosphatase superfamily)
MDFNLVNLECALTTSELIVLKVFNFKSDPKNVSALQEGNIYAVNLANNHILEFSKEGLLETLKTLDNASSLLTASLAAIFLRKHFRSNGAP